MLVAALLCSAWAAMPAAVPSGPMIFVEEGETAPALRQAIVRELGKARLTSTATAAEVRCRVMRRGDRLELEVHTKHGEPLRRNIPTSVDDLTPALRVAALLVTRAAGAPAKVAPKPTRERASSPPPNRPDDESGPAGRGDDVDDASSAAAPGNALAEPLTKSQTGDDLDDTSNAAARGVDPTAALAGARTSNDLDAAEGSEAAGDSLASPVRATPVGAIDDDGPAGPRLGELASLAAPRSEPPRVEVETTRASLPQSPWAVEAAVGLASSLWPRPVTPTVGPALRGTVTYDRLRFGLEGAWLGLFCCTASGDVEVHATELGLVASAEWVLFRSERFALDVGGGLGLRRVAGTARSTVFAAAGTEENFDLVQGLGRFSGAARLGLGERVSLSLAAGATVSVGARTVELPAAFSGAQAAFDSGAVVPWAVFSVAFHLVRGEPNFF